LSIVHNKYSRHTCLILIVIELHVLTSQSHKNLLCRLQITDVQQMVFPAHYKVRLLYMTLLMWLK